MSPTQNTKSAFHSIEIAELRADHELAMKYLKVALKALDDPEHRAAGIAGLQKITEAYCRREC